MEQYVRPTPEYSLPENFDPQAFLRHKGNLIWPIENGVVTDSFGIHKHPLFKWILVNNNGIDISTDPNAAVRSVYDGVVAEIISIPGDHQAVLVSHGNYFSLYSNLISVNVQRGELLKSGQMIGSVFTDAENSSVGLLKFQIWNEQNKLDPLEWLEKK